MRTYTSKDIAPTARVKFVDNPSVPFAIRLCAEGNSLVVTVLLTTRKGESASAQSCRASEAAAFARRYLEPGMRVVHSP